MNWKQWKMGVAVAFFCALADALGVYVAATAVIWGKVIAFAIIKGMGGATLYLRQHPVESVLEDQRPSIKGPLLWLVALPLFLFGCASFPTTVFRLEKTSADTAHAAVQAFNLYYQSATNGADVKTIAALNDDRDQIYDASRRLSASLSVLEAVRAQYATNAAVKGQVQGALSAVSAQSSNVLWLVNYFKNR